MASTFSLQTHPYGHEDQGNDHQLKKLLIVKQILLVSASGNVKRPVWRMCVLMLECKRLEGKIFLPRWWFTLRWFPWKWWTIDNFFPSQKIYVDLYYGLYLRRNDFVRYSRRGKFAILKDSWNFEDHRTERLPAQLLFPSSRITPKYCANWCKKL